MRTSSVFLRYSYPNNKHLRDVEISACDYETGKVLGSLKANVQKDAFYNGSKFPSSYVDVSKSRGKSQFVKPHLYVEKLFVNEAERNKGIGSKLVKAAAEESLIKGCGGRVVVTAANLGGRSPLPFYRKLGFKTGVQALDRELLDAAKYKYPFEKVKQAFMALSNDAISAVKKGLKAIR